jgi:regulator of replication initiation timing
MTIREENELLKAENQRLRQKLIQIKKLVEDYEYRFFGVKEENRQDERA